MKIRVTPLVVATLLMGAPVIAATAADSASALEISGPIMGGRQGAPFAAPTVDVTDYGYVTEEYFLAGSAAAYRPVEGSEQTEDGLWKTEQESETVPFKTRILVVRPANKGDFNGTVIVHWQNVTAGYELGSVSEGEYLRGYAWVGVSAQTVGIHGFPGTEGAGLEQWDPERYGSLKHPGDAYSYDIFSQAGRVIGPKRATKAGTLDPMGGLEVKRLIAAGASQSASRLRTYINGVHPLENVFDAYIPYIDFASTIPFGADRAGQRRGGRRPTRVRADLDVPVFVVNSETETEAYLPARQPDTGKFRFWEVAGTSHVNVARTAAASTEGLDSPNWLPYLPVYDAAVRLTHLWLTEGTAPPTMPPIKTEPGEGSGVAIQRDAHGNAVGGVRLPEVEVPTAEHRGRGKPVTGGNRFAFLYGYARDFTPEELAKLYPDPATYLARYDKALNAAVEAGVILEEDAPALREANKSWAANKLTLR